MRTMLATLVAMTIVGAWTSADAQVVTRGDRLARPILGRPIKEGTATLLQPLPAPANLRSAGSFPYAMLSWDAVAGATGYLVTRTDPNGVATTLTSTAITVPWHYDLSDLTPGQVYSYRVSAVSPNNSPGTSQPVTYSPPAPVGVAWVRAEWMPVEGDSRGTFSLTWSRRASVDGGYHVVVKILNGVTLSDFFQVEGQSGVSNDVSGLSLSNPIGPGTYVFSVQGCYRANLCAPETPSDTVTVP